jgi:hypothetical protein
VGRRATSVVAGAALFGLSSGCSTDPPAAPASTVATTTTVVTSSSASGGASTSAASSSTGGGGGATTGGGGTGGAAGQGASAADGGGDALVESGTDAPEVDARGDGAVTGPADSVIWAIDNVQSIGGHPTSVSGAPKVIDTPAGKAVQFNGVDDALFVEHNPVTGFSRFTVEVIFRPDADGAAEQRFFHITEDGNNHRVLFETRLPGNGTWILDTYVESTAGGAALFNAQLAHPIGPFYHAAVVVDGTSVRDYVNGVEEVTVPLGFMPHTGGRTSIGVRINKLYWYKGAMKLARFTPRVLAPSEFLKAN